MALPKTLIRIGSAEINAPMTIKNGPIPVSLNETSHAVAVVPTLEPNNIPRLAVKLITPASTRLTANAVTALLDCKTAVEIAPTINP